MKVAVCTRVGHIELQDWEVPQVLDDWVLVKVSICGICGSDVAAWHGSGHKKYPYVPGHEFCGVIEQTGGSVSGMAVGRRVVIDPNLGCGQCRLCLMGKPNLCERLKSRPTKSNGGLAEYVALDHRMVHPLPDELPDSLAPFIEPLSCALHAANTAAVESGQRIVIFGAGLMGCLTGMAMLAAEADIVFVEPAAGRRERVSSLLGLRGLTPAELARSDLPGTIDAAIDCSGNARAVAQAVSVLRTAGRLVLAGLVMNVGEECIPLMDVTTRELKISGVWLNPNTFESAIDLAVASKDILRNLGTDAFALDRIQAAFERASDHDAPKVLVTP